MQQKHILLILLFLPDLLQGQSFSNQSFDDRIKSVFLSPSASTQINSTIVNNYDLPVTKIGVANQLTLHFDFLIEDHIDLSYSFVHCNPDWSPSDLFTNEYLTGYEEDNLSEFTYSQNTSQNYIHYSQSFPDDNMSIIKSGNYVLLVYPTGNKNNVLLCQKFYVVDHKVTITPAPSRSMHQRNLHHQINFKINQNNINSTDPRNEFKVAVLKNQNHHNVKFLQPTYINKFTLTYAGSPTNLEAGNEFRQFDIRNINLNTKGVGVYKTIIKDNLFHTILEPNLPRNRQTYSSLLDHNGSQFIGCQSTKSAFSETDYSWVYFYLNRSQMDSSSNVYIWGGLTNWEKQPDARMHFNQKNQQYVGKLFLKQGVYDYVFLTEKEGQLSWTPIEGNFYETDNFYSVLVYHKNFTSNYYELVGLKSFTYQ